VLRTVWRALTGAALLSWIFSASAMAQPSASATLTTGAFEPGGPWSWRYTCYNAIEPSPPVAWSGLSEEAGSVALVLDAPDKPNGIGVHWLIYNLAPDLGGLPENVPKLDLLPNGALQGENDFGKIGYAAPCPPVLTSFTYQLTLYVLDQMLDLPPAASFDAFAQATQTHVIDQVQISGMYLRPAWPWG
jgi:Raf kinase inhibitor-like YbhB/YbcL family protein